MRLFDFNTIVLLIGILDQTFCMPTESTMQEWIQAQQQLNHNAYELHKQLHPKEIGHREWAKWFNDLGNEGQAQWYAKEAEMHELIRKCTSLAKQGPK